MVNKENLEYVSPYSAGSSASDDMTVAQYEYYLVQASQIFTNIDPGLSSTSSEYCKQLLVAHLYECSLGRTGYSSEGIGDYNYARIPGVLTAFKQQVIDLITSGGLADTSGAYQTEAGTRNDADILTPFTLDAEEQRQYPTI